jgi:uncharacterized protein YdcH (DUF465 family)
MSETPRMGDKEFEDLANCASMDYQISADAGDVYVDDVEKVKRIVAECRRARDAEAFERGARLIESNARQVAEAERDALVKDQANSTVEIAAVQARADKADAENTRLTAKAQDLNRRINRDMERMSAYLREIEGLKQANTRLREDLGLRTDLCTECEREVERREHAALAGREEK